MFQPLTPRRWSRAVAVPAVVGLTLGLLVVLAPVASAKPSHPRGGGANLTAAQKQCLTQHGVQVPTPASRSSLTAQQRQALVAALRACGVRAGLGHGFRGRMALTSAQRTCLTQHGVTLPGSGAGPGGAGGRQALRAAAQACGIPLGRGAPPTS